MRKPTQSELIWLIERLTPDFKTTANFRKDNGPNRDNNFTVNKIKRRREQIEGSIERYLTALETVDRQEPADFMAAKIQRLQDKVALLKQQMAKLDTIETELQKKTG